MIREYFWLIVTTGEWKMRQISKSRGEKLGKQDSASFCSAKTLKGIANFQW